MTGIGKSQCQVGVTAKGHAIERNERPDYAELTFDSTEGALVIQVRVRVGGSALSGMEPAYSKNA